MGIEELIGFIIPEAISLAPKIANLIREIHGHDPTPEQNQAVWDRHVAARGRILNEDVSTHPEG